MSQNRPAITIEARLASYIPLPAWWAGGALAIVLTGIGLWLHALSGVPPLAGGDTVKMSAQAHVTLLCSTLLAYGLTAARLAHEAGSGGVMNPRAWLHSRLAGTAGVAAGLVLILLTSRQIRLQEPGRNPWTVGELFVDVLSLLLLWGIGRAAYFTLRGAGANEYRSVPVDLWDLAPLQRFGQQGLRNALAWIVGISLLVVIMYFDPNPALQVDSGKVFVPLLLGSVAVAVLTLFLPLWTLKKRLQKEKADTLAAIDGELLRMRDAAVRGSYAPPGAEADLLARRNHIAGVSGWAIDTGTFRKLSFYLLFPAGSWFIGPFLRKIVDTFVFDSAMRSFMDFFP
jgi:hypothetical protein